MNRRDFLSKVLAASAAVSASSFANDIVTDGIANKIITDLKQQDIYLEKKYHNSFISVRNKLSQIQREVGYGNFNIISFDEVRNIPKWASHIEPFTKDELEFIDFIFYTEPNYHGFYGKRTCENLTDRINEKEIVKVPYTGHYLYQGKTLQTYHHMIKDVGKTIILTSGVRSVTKQMKLFLDKLYDTDMNLSVASKSLAPPAYSYHSIGDFDVGKKGFGYNNFTPRFALTDEFYKMKKLKYIDMRYTVNNKDGVRYEPWHIKVV